MPVGAEAPEEPEPPRILTADVTPERLGTLLCNNPKGLLNTRDELSGWLLGFDRYNKGGERSFWLEAYGARPYTIDRVKAGGSVHIPRLSISVFGGLQPDRLSSLLLDADDDFAGIAIDAHNRSENPTDCLHPIVLLEVTEHLIVQCLFSLLWAIHHEIKQKPNGNHRKEHTRHIEGDGILGQKHDD